MALKQIRQKLKYNVSGQEFTGPDLNYFHGTHERINLVVIHGVVRGALMAT